MGILQCGAPFGLHLPPMADRSILRRMGMTRGWSRELALAALGLIVGFGAMPMLIFYVGTATLGPYEGASVARTYDGVYRGLGTGSAASWIVVLGPYGIYLLFKTLRRCWRLGARAA